MAGYVNLRVSKMMKTNRFPQKFIINDDTKYRMGQDASEKAD